jgi:hypothetical protein
MRSNMGGASDDTSLRSFVTRGVLRFGVPMALVVGLVVPPQYLDSRWQVLHSPKFLFIVIVGAVPLGIIFGSMFGLAMWYFLGSRKEQ